MKIFNKFVSLLIIFSLILPLLADARAGRGGYRSGGGYRGSSSFRGESYRSRTYQGEGYNYRPRSNYGRPSTQAPYAYQNQARSGSFATGLFSGLLGAWLYSKLTNSSQDTAARNTPQTEKQAPNQQQATKQEGSIPWLLIIGLAVLFFLWRRHKNKSMSNRNQKNFDSFSDNPLKPLNPRQFLNMSKPVPERLVTDLTQDDHNTFEKLLVQIQNAWSKYDLDELRRLTTPEMFQNFSQIIHENQQQGITNFVSDVRLLNQELQDSGQEGDYTYARVTLTWSAIDYAVNTNLSPNDPSYLIDGSTDQPTQATETWTFEKMSNGSWLLSEIEQV